MNVLQEILNWSFERPLWQRDCLRRLLQNDELDENDLDELTDICKSGKGLVDKPETMPLAKKHLPRDSKDRGKVAAQSVHHSCGVNALADEQTLKFGNKLTVVYGDNAAGKSGYSRILKSAFRARGAEEILGNVLSGVAPRTPCVSIKYTVGDAATSKEWTGVEEDDALSRVSVFDTHSASVYLKEKTDVAFRPFGLDLFDKLSQACLRVKSRLERERSTLRVSNLTKLSVPENTKVAQLLEKLTSLTNPETVKTLAALSDEELAQLTLLEKKLSDLNANNPTRLARELNLRTGRLRTLKKHLEVLEKGISTKAIDALSKSSKDRKRKFETARKFRPDRLSPDLLNGTGSDNWAKLWEAARKFSEEDAYCTHVFPVTGNDARCVLCQQDVERDAAKRLKRLEEFVISNAEKEYRSAQKEFEDNKAALNSLVIKTEMTAEQIDDVRIEDEKLGNDIDSFISTAQKRREAVLGRLGTGVDLIEGLPSITNCSSRLDDLTNQLQERVSTLDSEGTVKQKESIGKLLQEFNARKVLNDNLDSVLQDIERKKRIAAYGLCIEETKTQSITTKSTAVTKVAVTDKLKVSFTNELRRINFKHVEVEIKEVGGERGILYHKLRFSRAPGYDLEKVVSEGEARALSIAAFFAELSTADDPSTIIFDDPVSSLDYKWRNNVARRLVEEARARQVIIFTHDIVFLLALRQFAGDLGIEYLDQHVRQLSIGAGVCDEDLPWIALPVKKRLGVLMNRWQKSEKIFRNGHRRLYEEQAIIIYGLLREAWERGLEEVLLGRVVERFRPSIQTMHISIIADISAEDCSAVELGMTKSSKWLPGHDQAPAAREEIPEPEEIRIDIEALKDWVSKINKRRR